jgi:hypothetical protein
MDASYSCILPAQSLWSEFYMLCCSQYVQLLLSFCLKFIISIQRTWGEMQDLMLVSSKPMDIFSQDDLIYYIYCVAIKYYCYVLLLCIDPLMSVPEEMHVMLYNPINWIQIRATEDLILLKCG